jgi:lactate racemase
MPTYHLPYGRRTLSLHLDTAAQVEQILPSHTEACSHPHGVINQALAAPVGLSSLRAFAGARSAAIAINDKTRPVPHADVLPPLLAALEELGIPREAITLIIATGTHIPIAPEAFAEVVPAEILARYRIVSHDCDAPDLVHLRSTPRGTPVAVNRLFMEADLRIVVGNVEPHHFAGFSGGVKSAAIGLAGRETITANHSLLMDPKSALAIYDENPLRQDIEAIGRMIDIHLALNVVMNRQKKIVEAFAGTPRAVIRAAMPLIRTIYETQVDTPFDVMITCPGGFPKDINLYQAHKAVSCANRVTREGGQIILVAACEDGVGSAGYAEFMARGFPSHQAVMAQFIKEPFRIGAHKAYIFGRDAVRLQDIWIVSDIPAGQVTSLLLRPADLQTAIAGAIGPLPPTARVGIMPYANATIPSLSAQTS